MKISFKRLEKLPSALTIVPYSTRFRQEGDTIVDRDADLVISSEHTGHPIPYILIEKWSDQSSPQQGCYNIITTFDQVWGRQKLLSLVLTGEEHDNGWNYESACLQRFIDFDHEVFRDTLIQDFIRENWKGPVTLTFNGSILTSILLGLSSIEAPTFYEMINFPLSQFLSSPNKTLLREKWSCGIALFCEGGPYIQESKSPHIVGRLTAGVMKHFWSHIGDPIKESKTTRQTNLGVVTAFEDSVQRAVKRAMFTCRNIEASSRRFRTDLVQSFTSKLNEVSRFC